MSDANYKINIQNNTGHTVYIYLDPNYSGCVSTVDGYPGISSQQALPPGQALVLFFYRSGSCHGKQGQIGVRASYSPNPPANETRQWGFSADGEIAVTQDVPYSTTATDPTRSGDTVSLTWTLNGASRSLSIPPSFGSTVESRMNYLCSLPANSTNYGLTGLACVIPFQSSVYGTVPVGTLFLFPGALVSNPPAYQGQAYVNAVHKNALLLAQGTLHGQLVNILGTESTNFVGFSVSFPFSEAGNIGFNSSTCNKLWFDDRALPENWQTPITAGVTEYLTEPINWVLND